MYIEGGGFTYRYIKKVLFNVSKIKTIHFIALLLLFFNLLTKITFVCRMFQMEIHDFLLNIYILSLKCK